LHESTGGITKLITRIDIERRQQPRIQLEEDQIVRIHAPRERYTGLVNFSITDGRLFDLNNLGAFVSTELSLEKGAAVDVEIALPGMRVPELVHALVARQAERFQRGDRTTPQGLGLRFLADNLREQERIRRIVMMTLTLDLLKYGYETRKTVRFWRDVLTSGQLPSSDWRPPDSTPTLITSSSRLPTDLTLPG
jgi:hypothetical protein